MTVEAKTEEELKNKVPPQEEEEDEDEDDPGVTPGEGKLLGFDVACFSYRGFREQAAQRKRRKRRSPRRRKRPSLTLQGWDFRNFSQTECIRLERSASIKTSKENSDLHPI